MAKWDLSKLPEGRKPLPDEWFRERAQMQERIEELEVKLAKAMEALEDASQIISQSTWTTMRVNGQYVDRIEVVQGYRAITAELKGEK